jgi:hypothetical protein
MNRMRLATVVIVIGTIGIAGGAMCYALAQGQTGGEQAGHMGHMSMNMNNMHMNMTHHAPAATLSLEKIHADRLPAALKSIDKASRAVKSGDKKTALAELKKARETLVAVQAALTAYVKPNFVNDRCPILGSPIDPDHVPANLIRDYKGQKVAFCCAGCPAQWDKLTDAQKQAKLAKVVRSSATQNAALSTQNE